MVTISGSRLLETVTATAQSHRLLAARSRDRFRTYFKWVWNYPIPPHIALICECLQAFEEDAFDRLLIIEPPGHAKSTVATISFPTWHLGRNPAHSIIGASTTGTIADMFQESIAEVLAVDEKYRAVFPGVVPDRKRGWSVKDGLFVTRPYRPGAKDPSLIFVGAGGPMISRRADLIVLDDVVDQDVARSEVKLNARVDWTKQTVRSRLKPGGKVLVVGTVWNDFDVLNTFRETGSYVTVIMRALSATKQVDAEVIVPDGIAWRPRNGVPFDPDAERRATLEPGRAYVAAEA